MELKLSLAQQQKLSMTMHMKQMIGLLQLSSLELLREVNSMLESCVLLERDDCTYLQGGSSGLGYHHSFVGQQYEEQMALPETLHDHLFWQLNFLSLTPVERLIAEILIDSINDKGYLTVTPEETLSILPECTRATEADVLAILKKIQQFEPVGIAARTQQECLSLQLERGNISSGLKKASLLLIEKCYPDLVNPDYSSLKKNTGLSIKTINKSMAVIRSLNPFPGWLIESDQTGFCIPDLIVYKRNKCWEVRLNKEVAPTIRINSYYVDAISKQVESKPAHQADCWKQQLKDARCFVRGLNNRYSTLLNVMRLLIMKQKDFLEQGEEKMQALSMRSIALELGLHESTISRVVQNKYVQTPRGVIPMNYFFSSTSGQGVSSVALQAYIRQLILQEDSCRPLSDAALQAELKALNIDVARRTVTKYRTELGFASSRQRKCR